MTPLEVQIGADATQYNKVMATLPQTATTASNQVSAALANASKATDNLGGSALSASMRMQQMRSGISAARDGVLAFTVGGQAAERSLLAMGHHINSLVNETGSFTGAMKALGQSLLGPGGVILAFSVLSELVLHYANEAKKAKDVSEALGSTEEAHAEVMKKLDSSYAEAVVNVSELTVNVDLAKKGFIDKGEVIKEYNDKMGKTTGAVKTLAEVEDKLVKAAPAYLEMMFLKAKAQTAFKEAADKSVEAQKAAAKSDEESLGFFDKVIDALGSGSSAGLSGVGGQFDTKMNEDLKKQDAAANRKKQVDSMNKDVNLLKSIGAEAQKAAAVISKAFGFDFLGDEQNKGKKKDPKTMLQELEAQLTKLQDEENKWISEGNKQDFFNLTARERNINAIIAKIEELKAADKGVSAPMLRGTRSTGDFVADSIAGGLNQAGVSKPMYAPKDMMAGLQAWQKLSQAQLENRQIAYGQEQQIKRTDKAYQGLVGVIGQGLTGAFNNALSGTQSFVSSMSQFLAQLIERLIAAALAAAALAAILSFTGLGAIFGLSSGLASNFGTLFGSLSGLKLADGGITMGATHAIIGEGREKEAVMPLSKLQQFVNNGSGKVQLEPVLIRGDMFLKQKTRAEKSQSRRT